jgi:uncharacterized membrane protein
MSILKDLPELIKANIITDETADKIRNYYGTRKDSSTNRLFIVFGILGSILVGLGIILIVAHNWDELSRSTKTFFAFLPLIVGQIFCGFVLIKKQESIAWRESSSAFLFFAVGACISLVSQIYNIPGEMDSFLRTWMLLCLPLVYVMRSSITSLLYLNGITYYATLNYWSYSSPEHHFYWLLLLGILPHYYMLYKNRPEGNFMIFHNWSIPLSLIISLGTVTETTGDLMYVAYISLFGLFYLIGSLDFFAAQKTRNNGYKVLGSLGTLVLLLALSFDWYWQALRTEDFKLNEMITSPEFFAATILSLLAGGAFYLYQKNKPFSDIKPLAPIFILFIVAFILGMSSPVAVVLINLFIFGIGILTIRSGAKQDHLGILNFGLSIITALVICRFFDSDLSFVIRGILFVLVGAGFFAGNYLMLKKRRAND